MVQHFFIEVAAIIANRKKKSSSGPLCPAEIVGHRKPEIGGEGRARRHECRDIFGAGLLFGLLWLSVIKRFSGRLSGMEGVLPERLGATKG